MRQLELTPKLIDEITTYIENGNSNVDTCKLCGISDSAFYEWIQDAKKYLDGDTTIKHAEIKVDLMDAIKRAEAGFKAFHVNNITKSSRKNWTASAWLLERKYPKEYGRVDRNAVTITDNGMLGDILGLMKRIEENDDGDE